VADDLQRWLADEPVSVWREPLLVRTRRWIKKHRTLVSTAVGVVMVAVVLLSAFGFVLGQKNRELRHKNAELETNFTQAHGTLRDVIEFAQRGRTLGDNVLLDPVRLEMLERAVPYLDGLLAQQPEDRHLHLEKGLLLTALGDVSGRLGKRAEAERVYREALEGYGSPTPEDSVDFRHARALAQLRLALILPMTRGKPTTEAQTLLDSACAGLAQLNEEQQESASVVAFHDRQAPALLLAEGVIAIPETHPQYRVWLALADSGLLQYSSRPDRPQELWAQSLRGQLWYEEASKANRGGGDAPRTLAACMKAKAACQRCITLATKADPKSVMTHRWALAMVESIEARALVATGKLTAALELLKQASGTMEALVLQFEQDGERIHAAWQEIDRTTMRGTSGPLGTWEWRLVLLESQSRLGELLWELNRAPEAKTTFAQVEIGLKRLPAAQAWPLPARLVLGQCQIRLAGYLANQPGSTDRARRWANEARQHLEACHIPVAEDLNVYMPLCLAYGYLGKLDMPRSLTETIGWLEKTNGLRPALGRPSAPIACRIAAASCATLLAEAYIKADPPRYAQVCWQTAREALAILDSLPQQGKELGDWSTRRGATQSLVKSAIVRTVDLFEQTPCPRDEIRRTCEPARVALRKLEKLAGPLPVKDREALEMLETFCNKAQ
jgi:tetratricopeptide (TPR) repeat protein